MKKSTKLKKLPKVFICPDPGLIFYEQIQMPEHAVFANIKIAQEYGPGFSVFVGALVKEMLITGKPFVLRHEDLIEQMGFTLYQIRKYKKILQKLDVLWFTKEGIPAKQVYCLNFKQLDKLLGLDKVFENVRGREKSE